MPLVNHVQSTWPGYIQGIGTLSMGDKRGGYGVPMSFGYDRTRERCILQIPLGEFGDAGRTARAHR